MTVLSELEQFVAVHRAHGPIRSSAEDPSTEGYRAWATCACGAAWTRWVTEAEATVEMLMTDFPTLPD